MEMIADPNINPNKVLLEALLKFALPLTLLMLFFWLCTGCSHRMYPEKIEIRDSVRINDTTYIERVRDSVVYRWLVDSTYIYSHDSVSDRMRGDTVYITRWKTNTEYRYRTLHDSIYINRIDTIYRESAEVHTTTDDQVVVEEVRYIPGFYKWSTWVCWIIIACFVLYIGYRVLRVYLKIQSGGIV